MRNWKVGQRVVCDRSNKQLTGCFVKAINSDSIVIFCPEQNTVICGQRSNLEKLGWRVTEPQEEIA